jgi:hypothetical protein
MARYASVLISTSKEHQPHSLVPQGSQDIDARHRKHRAMSSHTLDEDRFTHAFRLIASRIERDAMSQVLYAGSNVESKSQENEIFHEQTLLSLMKRWYKPN